MSSSVWPKMGCCVFLLLPSSSRHRYQALLPLDDGETTVTVVVGKKRRVFNIDPFILEEGPFRVLMEMSTRRDDSVIFIDVDAILFEHLLWMVYNDGFLSSSSMLQLNLKDIIEFYSQDS